MLQNVLSKQNNGNKLTIYTIYLFTIFIVRVLCTYKHGKQKLSK